MSHHESNSSDTIGNQTRDLPVCSAVPQLNASRRAPIVFKQKKTCNLRSYIKLYKVEYEIQFIFCIYFRNTAWMWLSAYRQKHVALLFATQHFNQQLRWGSLTSSALRKYTKQSFYFCTPTRYLYTLHGLCENLDFATGDPQILKGF